MTTTKYVHVLFLFHGHAHTHEYWDCPQLGDSVERKNNNVPVNNNCARNSGKHRSDLWPR